MSNPPDFQRYTTPPRLAPRSPDAHKGVCGRVAVVAGSLGMSGAAYLAGLAALRGGAGLVQVLTAARVQPILATLEPSLLTMPLMEDASGRIELLEFCGSKAHSPPGGALRVLREWAGVVALGPGLGQSPALAQAVTLAVRETTAPLVLDADGLNAIAGVAVTLVQARQAATVLTPHPGEFLRLLAGAGIPPPANPDWATDDAQREKLALAYRAACGQKTVLVLKGRRTLVVGVEGIYVNSTGNPGLATGGMGDVLTGLIAALIAQGMSPFAAACFAVHVHGAAADIVARRVGAIGYLAREVADALPQALEECGAPRMGFRAEPCES